MKKIVLAAMLATASLTANAQVVLGGKLSLWMDSTKVGDLRDSSVLTEPNSNLFVGVKENLQNGLMVKAVVETSLVDNTINGFGTRLGDRQTTVGLTNKLGSLDLGRNVHSLYAAVKSNDAFDALYGSVAGDVHNLRGLRLSDTVFVTVNPVKNAVVSYNHQMDGARAFGGNVLVAGFKVSLARYQDGDEVSNLLAVNRKFGKNTTVFLSYSDDKGVVKSKGTLAGVKHQLNNVSFKASFGKTNDDVKAYSLGADYHFTKRTEAGVAFRKVDRDGSLLDVEQFGVGLTHRF